MQANELQKKKVIENIDFLLPHLRGSVYHTELKMIRLKYIYKDISSNELQNDKIKLKSIYDILNWAWLQK